MQMGQFSVPVPCEGKKQCFVLSRLPFVWAAAGRDDMDLATLVQLMCPVASLRVDSRSSQVHRSLWPPSEKIRTQDAVKTK